MNNNANANKKSFLVFILSIIIIALGGLCIYFAMRENTNTNSNRASDNQSTKETGNEFSTYVSNLEKRDSYQDVVSPNFDRTNPIYSVRVELDGTVSVTFHTYSIDEDDNSVTIGKSLESKYGNRYKLPIKDVISAYAVLDGNAEGEEESLVFLKKDGTMYTINNEEMNSNNHTISLTKLSCEKIIYVYTAISDGGAIYTVGVDINGNTQQMIIPKSE